MSKTVRIRIDGIWFSVVEGVSVAAAMQRCSLPVTRLSVSGEKRAPFCGMGVCQECRIHINGVRRLGCQTLVREGMDIRTLSGGGERREAF